MTFGAAVVNSCERRYVARLPRCGSVAFEICGDDLLGVFQISAPRILATDPRVCVISAVNLKWAEGFAFVALDRSESAACLDLMERGEEGCGRRGVSGDHERRE